MIKATPLINTAGLHLDIRAYILPNNIVLINSYIDTGTAGINGINTNGLSVAKFDFNGKLIMGVMTPMTDQVGAFLCNVRITQEGIVLMESQYTSLSTYRRGGFVAITFQF